MRLPDYPPQDEEKYRQLKRKLFCETNETCYKISVAKEILLRNFRDLFSREKIARARSDAELPVIVKSHASILLRKLHGVDMQLQENKKTNIALASVKINGIIIHPGETFSFWRMIGNPSEKRGYKVGLVISRKGFLNGPGGGLCQLANMIHWLVLNSPLTVTELHHHSDALFPDDRRRVPFGTGTSVAYNYVDYRFKNTTDQDVQILVWCEEGELCGELRCQKEFPLRYRLVEENHHFQKEQGKYYRISQVYKIAIERASGREVWKKLVLDNHSEVMYDYSLIPEDQIKDSLDGD